MVYFVNRFEYCEIPKCTEEEVEQMGLCTDVDCGVGVYAHIKL